MEKPMPPFLRARWENIAMLNFEAPTELLSPLVPRGVELDAFGGRTYLSLVGFLFLDTRIKGISIPFHGRFEEVNLRYYVRREGPEGVRRGVVFIQEIAPRRAVTFLARQLYNENYVTYPMRHSDDGAEARPRRVRYEWRPNGSWNGVGVTVSDQGFVPPDDSLETFITEHYWGYAAQPDGSTLEYRVEHPRWRVWRADEHHFECDVERVYGADYSEILAGTPSSAFLADGSEVVVRKGRRLRE